MYTNVTQDEYAEGTIPLQLVFIYFSKHVIMFAIQKFQTWTMFKCWNNPI